MKKNQIHTLCRVLKTDLLYEAADGTLTPFFDILSLSPLTQSDTLRRILREGAQMQKAPFLYTDEQEYYFAGIRAEEGFLYMGPMCHKKLKGAALARMYNSYGISGGDYQTLPVFTLPQIRDMLLLTNMIVDDSSLGDEEVLTINHILERDENGIQKEKTLQTLKEEEEDDSAAYRHSYQEEQLLMQAVREGQPETAVRYAENMDRDSGQLSKDYLRHRRNLAIIGIALCSRAAIEGGMSPETAYRISGYYIGKVDASENAAGMLLYRNQAITDMAGHVGEKRSRPASSNYVERCKDYVRKHYREKIYLDEIAESLGLSPTYLSRLFSRETGECLQDYINSVRVYHATNLLLYSDQSLPEIAQYVGFPNQSYFGKIFKKLKNMSPKAYRDRYRSAEY